MELDRGLYILLDPEKEGNNKILQQKAHAVKLNDRIKGILVGGSTLSENHGKSVVDIFKRISQKSVIGFPGSAEQVYKGLNALLFLNYLNSDEAVFTRTEPLRAIKAIQDLSVPTIACAYIVIHPEKKSSSTLIHTQSIAFSILQRDEIMDRIALAWHFGQRYLYLEAGSGSKFTIDVAFIREIKIRYPFFILVGGGIKHKMEVDHYLSHGADAVVIGTAVEQNPSLIGQL